jgi:hypothetical protein
MPVKRKLNRKVTKVPRNFKINSKSSKRASQKKRGRKASKRQRGGFIRELTSSDLFNTKQEFEAKCKELHQQKKDNDLCWMGDALLYYKNSKSGQRVCKCKTRY